MISAGLETYAKVRNREKQDLGRRPAYLRVRDTLSGNALDGLGSRILRFLFRASNVEHTWIASLEYRITYQALLLLFETIRVSQWGGLETSASPLNTLRAVARPVWRNQGPVLELYNL